MRLEVYFTEKPLDNPVNDGFDPLKIWALLTHLKETKGTDFKIIDATAFDESDIMDVYEKRAVVASWQGFGIRKVFGSNRSPGWLFGKRVPALVVIEDEKPVAIYPSQRKDTGLVTIRAFLESLGAISVSPQELIDEMDKARHELRPIDMKTSELVHEGRHR